MLNLSELLESYPLALRIHRSFILREYLQCKILEILFEGPYASRFCFLGGTCLRLVHNNSRFSEDLDFDNFQVTESEFGEVSESIRIGLEQQGFQVEMKQVIRGAYHCYIRFPGLLFEQGLSGYREEKILIQLDTEPQHFNFEPEPYMLNRFDVTTQILTTPPAILLAQKFTALCQRKKNKGARFFRHCLSLVKVGETRLRIFGNETGHIQPRSTAGTRTRSLSTVGYGRNGKRRAQFLV